MKLDGSTIVFSSLNEAQVYIRAARSVLVLSPPSSSDEGEKYSEGEWDLLLQIALQLAEGDKEYAEELVKSVVVPAVFMAALEFAHLFDEEPYVFVVPSGADWQDAFFDEEEANLLAKHQETWVDKVWFMNDGMDGSED